MPFSPARLFLLGAFFVGGAGFSRAFAEDFAPLPDETSHDISQSAAEKLGASVRERLTKGQLLMEADDPRATAILSDAAQSSLALLPAANDVLRVKSGALPTDALTVRLANIAADAHYQWGLSADRFGRRDESITAYARALRLANGVAAPNEDLVRDISLNLSRVLRRGLPLFAPDDVLQTIAEQAHGGLWQTARENFATPKISATIGAKPGAPAQFLITNGKLFPPVAETNGAAQLIQIPPLYRQVAADRLPSSLLLDKMVAGYTLQSEGANKNQWRQFVRVFYASPFLTKNRRDDLPRAQKLASQFLRVHELFADQLGSSNLYARGDKTEGVTTLWLLEISALWPADDDDPAVLAALGPKMPAPNVGAGRLPTEAAVTTLTRPWNAPVSGQTNAAPGEILFWKASMERPETEWLRELMHEYGHVALPAFSGFRPPLEPFGNGKIGETLGMLWAAQNPDAFARGLIAPADSAQFAGEVRAHVEEEAFASWKDFVKNGPKTPVARGGGDELRLLQGASVAIERIYGAQFLGKLFAPMMVSGASDTMAARRLNLSSQSLLGAPNPSAYGTAKTLPIWLAGALNANLSLDNFINRGALNLKAGQHASGWLWIPSGTVSLRIEGANAGKISGLGLPFKADATGVRLYFAGASGWQPIALMAGADAKIESARLERG